jgi:ATP-binding cassette subfamily B (MDR/TAP) protein 7
VAEEGTHEELLAISGGVYSRLWQAQLSESTQSLEEEEIVAKPTQA